MNEWFAQKGREEANGGHFADYHTVTKDLKMCISITSDSIPRDCSENVIKDIPNV